MGTILLLLPPAAAGILAWLLAKKLVARSIAFAEARAVLAHPGGRASHATPTPRLGGVGMIGALLVVASASLALSPLLQRFVGLSPIDPVDWRQWGAALAAIAGAFLLGLWDDLSDPPALAKLAGQCLIALVPPLAGGLAVREIAIPYGPLLELSPLVGGALAFLWILAAMNAVNFMDGANGIAGRVAQAAGVFFFAMGANAAWRFDFAMLGAALFGAATAFLAFNAPRARTFLGDCGSQALGAAIAVGALLLANNDLRRGEAPFFDPWLAGVALIAPLLLDTGWTLARRTLAGRNPLEAHREHLYQRVMDAAGGDHEAACWHVERAVYACAVGGYFLATPQWNSGDGTALFGLAVVAAGLAVYAGSSWKATRGAKQADSG